MRAGDKKGIWTCRRERLSSLCRENHSLLSFGLSVQFHFSCCFVDFGLRIHLQVQWDLGVQCGLKPQNPSPCFGEVLTGAVEGSVATDSAVSTPTEAFPLYRVPDDLAGGESHEPVSTAPATIPTIIKMCMKVH